MCIRDSFGPSDGLFAKALHFVFFAFGPSTAGTIYACLLYTSVVAQLLYLEGQDPDKDISLYINSPGGSLSAGMAIHDTMQLSLIHISVHSRIMLCSCCRSFWWKPKRIWAAPKRP